MSLVSFQFDVIDTVRKIFISYAKEDKYLEYHSNLFD